MYISKVNNNRVDWIDLEKGFILLSVCLLHAGVPCKTSTFHMAAFFFISGLLYNPEKYTSLKDYFYRKLKTLLLPYLFLSFLFLLIYIPIYDPQYTYEVPDTVEKIIGFIDNEYLRGLLSKLSIFTLDIFLGESAPNTNPLWFVYSLFQISCLFAIAYNLCKRLALSQLIMTFFCITCFMTGWLLSKYNIKIPFKIDTTITGLAFYGMGVLCRKFLLDTIKNYSLIIISSFCILFFILFIFGYNQIDERNIGYIHNSLGNSFYGYLLASIFDTWTCTLFFYLLSHIKLGFVGNILKYIANNGIIILAVHFFVISCCIYLLKGHVSDTTYQYLLLLLMITVVGISIPFFNKYLYWAIGKNKKTL